MFNPNFEGYPQNENGRPEFASVILTIDSALARPEDEHVVQKFVLSTQDVMTSLISLFPYFGDPDLLSNPGTVEMIRSSGRALNPVFVYVTPRQGVIQVVTDCNTWDMLEAHPAFGDGSLLVLSERLTEAVAKQLAAFSEQRGGFPRLFYFDIEPAPAGTGEELASESEEALRERVNADQVRREDD